jgi:protoporphyrinogen/coproporphyrinogen III oxidase
LPANRFAEIVSSSKETKTLQTMLESIDYVDVAVVNLIYSGSNWNLKGFGFLVPHTQIESASVIGVVYDSCSFPEQSKSTHKTTCMTAMMGGSSFPSKFGNADTVNKEMLKDAAINDIERILGVPKDKLIDYEVNIQKSCLPRYYIGHYKKVLNIESELLKYSKGRLRVTGASYKGVSLNDCIYNTKLLCNEMP